MRVIVVTGLPGTGKSTQADLLAGAFGTPAFSGDWLLGALAPHGVLTGLHREALVSVHDSLLTSLVTRQLLCGQDAIVDCMATDALAERWRSLVEEHGGELFVIECVCSDEREHRRRVQGRRRNIPGWHEVDWDHVQRMRAAHPPLTVSHLTVDSMKPRDVVLQIACDFIGGGGGARQVDAPKGEDST